MPKLIDLTGKMFGRLLILERAEDYILPKGGRVTQWKCQCESKTIVVVAGNSLRRGLTKSCGCFSEECRKATKNKTHGDSKTRLFNIWCGMKQRCNNPNAPKYQNYGGRGIAVCDEWKNSFEKFRAWVLNNGYSDDLTIDRINNDGNYEPDNCRWATVTEQNQNKRNVKRR